MPSKTSFRQNLERIVFRDDSKTGRWFDIGVMALILISVSLVIIDSVDSVDKTFHEIFVLTEWVFTILFTIEYLMRIYAAPNRWKYMTSFFGIVDFLAIAPSYIGIFVPGTRHLLIIRILRILRIFRIFQMGHFVSEGSIMASALKASKIKILVFMVSIWIVAMLLGALMYMVEADYNPNINNIPRGIYWAIVTLTTVGYGDIIPVTVAGRILASMVMILGYGIIAVPTGIVTAEIAARVLGPMDRLKLTCKECGNADHLKNSNYCHHCGHGISQKK